MALATTCPQCKTSFKVIPDQLKLRRGLVRCGVCQHVFSGIDYLRYVDDSGKARQKSAASPGSAGAPGPAGSRRAGAARSASSPAVSPSARAAPAAQQADGAGPASPQTVIAADDELKTAFFLSDSTFGPYSQTRPQDVVPPRSIVAKDDDERLGGSADTAQRSPDHRPEHHDDAQARNAAGRDTRMGAPTRLAHDPRPSSRRHAGDAEPAQPSASPRHRSRTSLLGPVDDEDPDVAAANLLARQAREAFRGGSGGKRTSRSHSSRWDGHGDDHGPYESFGAFFADPRRRYAVIGLALLAALQLSLLFRSEIASRAPPLRPAVGVLAGAFGMSVDAVRSLSSLSIESFELQATGRNDHLALNAVLRNKDGHAVRWPAMELTLTDQSSAVVVRKVILPGDYLNRSASRDGLNGRSEWPIRINLDPGGLQLAGYSVALFYP